VTDGKSCEASRGGEPLSCWPVAIASWISWPKYFWALSDSDLRFEAHGLVPCFLDAFALGGPSTPDNIALRCRRHNQYEAEWVFGPRHGGS